jgi:hypothetical protein
MHRLARTLTIFSMSMLVSLASLAQETGSRLVKELEFKSVDDQPHLQNGKVLFRHYDSTGNSQNLVEIDVASGSYRNLLERLSEPSLVADSARYLVYSAKGTNANPLVVLDKATGAKIASKKLRLPIMWGHIDADRLIVLQSNGASSSTASALVFRLPSLKIEQTTTITGGQSTALWNGKIVSLGSKLGIHDLDLHQIAQVDLPPRNPKYQNSCSSGPLRIYRDKAVFGANCGQLAVVDLPTARLERVISAESNIQSFDVADGMILTSDASGILPDVRVIDMSSGRELARLDIQEQVLTIRGNRLLGVKRSNFSTPVRFSIYELDLVDLKSDEKREARATSGCLRAKRQLGVDGDHHAAIEKCERAGIKAYVGRTDLSPPLSDGVAQYGVWLTRTLSRFEEGKSMLTDVSAQNPDSSISKAIAEADHKIRLLNAPSRDKRTQLKTRQASITPIAVDFGSFSNELHFEGDRIYIGRWACSSSGSPGVTLDILDRKSFKAIKRIDVAGCDEEQQDAITAIAVIPGFVVLGLQYRYPEEGRPNVVVVNAKSLEIERRGNLNQRIAGLQQWSGRLLSCASSADQSSYRFDPLSARLVAAARDEILACANGDTTPVLNTEIDGSEIRAYPVAETVRYRVFPSSSTLGRSYRISDKATGSSVPTGFTQREYVAVMAIPDRDQLILLPFAHSLYRRFDIYDIEAKQETHAFELEPGDRPVAAAVWQHFLFVTLGRDLLAYDLNAKAIRGYEKEPLGEGFLNNCCGVDRNGITRLMVDKDRLIALSFDGANSFVLDLPKYVAGLPKGVSVRPPPS